MYRITMKQLESKVETINNLVGAAKENYSLDKSGRNKANIGRYYIDNNMGGVSLVMIVSDGGGVRTMIGRTTKPSLNESLSAFIYGLQIGKEMGGK